MQHVFNTNQINYWHFVCTQWIIAYSFLSFCFIDQNHCVYSIYLLLSLCLLYRSSFSMFHCSFSIMFVGFLSLFFFFLYIFFLSVLFKWISFFIAWNNIAWINERETKTKRKKNWTTHWLKGDKMSMKLKQRQSETSLKVSWQYVHRTLSSASTVHRCTVMRFFLHKDCYNSVNVIHVIVKFDIKRWTGYI